MHTLPHCHTSPNEKIKQIYFLTEVFTIRKNIDVSVVCSVVYLSRSNGVVNYALQYF